jgi:hypothetical protein
MTSLSDSMVFEDYVAALEEKGAGSGTSFGFNISNFSTYQEQIVTFYDFYNACSIDYYMQSIGANTQSVPGLMNFATNNLFRIYDSSDLLLSTLSSAITEYMDAPDDSTDDFMDTIMESLGEAAGLLFSTLLSVEIPTISDSESINYY